MPYDPTLLRDLVDHPGESLAVEVKGWLDLSSLPHRAKVVKTLMALRNQNGGYMIFGFDNATMKLDASNPKPADTQGKV